MDATEIATPGYTYRRVAIDLGGDKRHNSDVTIQGQLLWEPTAGAVADAAMTRFRHAYAPHCGNSSELHNWSITHPNSFWNAAWDFCGVVGDRGSGPAVIDTGMRSSQFFPGAEMCYAENLLSGGNRSGASPVAVISIGENGDRIEITWHQLRQQVAAAQQWLRRQGVQRGDHVAAWVPNTPQALVAMLATNSIGAVFTSTSPDFGVSGVLDRFAQVNPKVLIAADGYRYNGKEHERLSELHEVVRGLPGVRAVAVAAELGRDLPISIESVPLTDWHQLLAEPVGELEFVRQPISEPGLVLYSSGTTGKPKCIVHTATGVLLKQLTEHQLHCGITPGDRVFYYTTCGWMMWNWLVSTLASGATIVLYDGSPMFPDPEGLWELAASEQVTLFGTSAKFLDACAKAGVKAGSHHDLKSLRTITSTGSPLSAEGFAYVYRNLKSDVHLASISGGTDLCGCFVLGDPTRAVHAGEIQGPALGCAIDVWDEVGQSLYENAGVRGELVCLESFPSMPLKFANDPDGERYTSAYFERYPGVWAQGDFASWTKSHGFVIHGRSDATLNAGGVRIGTAEIYRQVEQLPEVAESLAIGQEWEGDTRIVLFLRLQPGQRLDETLSNKIRSQLRVECSPRHVPARIMQVSDLPRTRSGKLAELAVSDVVHDRKVRNTAALANPESLQEFADLPDLSR